MIVGGQGGQKEQTNAWLAELGVQFVVHPVGSQAWVAHTNAPGGSHHQDDDLVVVAESRLAREEGATSDAQAIADAYRTHGLACVPRLRGTFSFVLHDRRSDVLAGTSGITSRRPLAYWFHQDTVVLGSRILPLLRHPRAPRATLDEAYLADLVLGYGALPAGTTPFRHVRRLPAGVALVVRRGTVAEQRVDSLAPRRRGPSRSSEVDALWNNIEAAVAHAWGAHEHPCLSLSGGVDSAVVASAAVNVGGPLAMFSMVAPSLAGAESDRIDALRRTWPTAHLQRLDASSATAYPDLARFGLRDDPPLLPLSLLSARLQLWSAMQVAGFDAVLDGEGGDELFGSFVTPHDAFRQGEWRILVQYLRARPNWRSLVLRSVLFPLLPPVVGKRWARRWDRGGGRLPPYLRPAATEHPAFQEVTERFYGRWTHRAAIDLVQDWLSWPTGIGALASHEHLARQFGLELVSPLLDRDVIELVLGLHPASMLSPNGDKHFLRGVLARRVPDSVRLGQKDTNLAFGLGSRIVTSPLARHAIRDPRVRERFSGWIRFEKLEALLDALERDYRPSEWGYWQIECIITLCEWYARASREYGVQ